MTAESPARPSLEQAPTKPDILFRLRCRLTWWTASGISEADDRLSAEMDRTAEEDIRDAIAVIQGLRESDARRLVMIEDLKRELADARVEEGR